jgi:hypothetical protein
VCDDLITEIVICAHHTTITIQQPHTQLSTQPLTLYSYLILQSHHTSLYLHLYLEQEAQLGYLHVAFFSHNEYRRKVILHNFGYQNEM